MMTKTTMIKANDQQRGDLLFNMNLNNGGKLVFLSFQNI